MKVKFNRERIEGFEERVSYKKERLLIISNNVISNTDNNGKTILSFIKDIDKIQIRQLYFSKIMPTIPGVSYFRISDEDMLKGMFVKKKRGCIINSISEDIQTYNSVGTHGDFKRFLREFVWLFGFKSKALISWLDEFNPTAVFFVGGDCCFAYRICEYVVKRFSARLSVYITDDYMMRRKYDSLVGRIRRSFIRKSFQKCLKNADNVFTVSDYMRGAYLNAFGIDSTPIVNMSEDLKNNNVNNTKDKNKVVITYAGSLYYGRDKSIGEISSAIEKIAEEKNLDIVFNIYSLQVLTKEIYVNSIKGNRTKFYGAVKSSELKKIYNDSDILIFVESFEQKQIEKVKYSLSTKITEYLSLEKPIFAIGPKEVGSLVFLKDIAVCVNDLQDVEAKLLELILDESERNRISRKARDKFVNDCNVLKLRKLFMEKLFGY